MDGSKLNEIIEKHKKWLENKGGGERADLCGADLYGANLCEADLRRANLCGADLRRADLCGADLRRANLCEANLCEADLYGANLCGADLRRANLCGADLRGANNVPFIPMSCPDSGAFIAWKRAGNYIIKLLIPEEAKRSSATGRKCRCDRAVVLEIQEIDGTKAVTNTIFSDHDRSFGYTIGETVSVNNFCMDRFEECAPGIHFFINRQEAVDYGRR